MIKHEFLKNDGNLIIEHVSSLQETDFDMLSTLVDTYIQEKGKLNRLVIHTESFPGWQVFASKLAHIKFVKADVKHFGADDLEGALDWIKQD